MLIMMLILMLILTLKLMLILKNYIPLPVPSLLPWALPILAFPGKIVSRTSDGEFNAESFDRGLKQGGPMTNSIFPISLSDPIRRASIAARALDPHAMLFAYQDDVYNICTPEAERAGRAAVCALRRNAQRRQCL